LSEERDKLVVFSVFSFVLIIAAIWFFAYKRSRAVDNTSSEGYFLGGRSLTAVTIAGSIIMTNLHGADRRPEWPKLYGRNGSDGLGSYGGDCHCHVGPGLFAEVSEVRCGYDSRLY